MAPPKPTYANHWIPGLDGLRAAAVLLVLVHHFNTGYVGQWALGNVGVAIFYCLSGFLAYTVLDRDRQQTGAIFYEPYLRRRALRIWPLYFTVVIVTLGLIALFSEHPIHANEVVPLFLFSVDFQLGHWQGWPPMALLSPLWSIAVEEQFYILAPLLYLALRSRFSWAFVAGVFIIANAARFYLAAHETQLGNGGFYYLPYSYIDVFVAGALLAQWRLQKAVPKLLKTGNSLAADVILGGITLVLAGVVLRLWGMTIFKPLSYASLVPYLLLPFLGVLILSFIIHGDRLGITRIFAWKPLRIAGLLSYGAYLVHLPVYYLLTSYMEALSGAAPTHGLKENIAALTLVFAVAALLNWTVERPFLKMKQKTPVPSEKDTISGIQLPWFTLISVGLVTAGVVTGYATH